MKIRNDSPVGDLDVPLLRRVVARGEVVDVSEEQAERLLPQAIWSAADAAAKRVQARIDKADEAADEEGEVTTDGDAQ